jgi:hypothetical protein
LQFARARPDGAAGRGDAVELVGGCHETAGAVGDFRFEQSVRTLGDEVRVVLVRRCDRESRLWIVRRVLRECRFDQFGRIDFDGACVGRAAAIGFPTGEARIGSRCGRQGDARPDREAADASFTAVDSGWARGDRAGTGFVDVQAVTGRWCWCWILVAGGGHQQRCCDQPQAEQQACWDKSEKVHVWPPGSLVWNGLMRNAVGTTSEEAGGRVEERTCCFMVPSQGIGCVSRLVGGLIGCVILLYSTD